MGAPKKEKDLKKYLKITGLWRGFDETYK